MRRRMQALAPMKSKQSSEGGIPFPIRHVKLQPLNIRNQFQFRWNIEADEKIKEQTLEVSPDGNDFRPLAEMSADDRSYALNSRPAYSSNTGCMWYLKVVRTIIQIL